VELFQMIREPLEAPTKGRYSKQSKEGGKKSDET
jgi:hypothetical protein